MIQPVIELQTEARMVADGVVACCSCGESADIYADVLPVTLTRVLPVSWSCGCGRLVIAVSAGDKG